MTVIKRVNEKISMHTRRFYVDKSFYELQFMSQNFQSSLIEKKIWLLFDQKFYIIWKWDNFAKEINYF